MPHYLGGKLGRSSSRSIFPSIHLTPRALPRAASTIPLRSRSPRLDFAGEKRNDRAIRFAPLSLSLSLSLSCSRILLFPLGLYIVYFRIGSLSTRDPPPSPLSYGPIVVSSVPLSRSLSPSSLSSWRHHSTTPILRFPRTERACDNLLGRSSGPRLVRPVLTLCQPFLLSPFLHRMTVSHQRSPSIGPVRSLSPYPASPYFYHPFFSFLYLIAALFMPGPANKHMNARAFSGAHTTRP